jgi:putative transposase
MTGQPGHPPIAFLCQAAGVSRAAYYRHWSRHAPLEMDTSLLDRIQELTLEHRYYGYQRIHQLLKREGWEVNHKRVLRLMRQDNLLSLRRRAWVSTTRSDHAHTPYPNRAFRLPLSGINQLWVADITYVRMREQFVYAAIVMDAYSRRVIGWAADRHLQKTLPLAALHQALESRAIPEGLIHHSDRGVQYACEDYVEELMRQGIRVSMSRAGNPYDNAKAESFIKTLKAEALDGRKFRNLEEARNAIGSFIEEHYNAARLHSALGYRSPVEFERQLQGPTATPAASEFLQA